MAAQASIKMKDFSFQIGALEVVARVYRDESRGATKRHRGDHGTDYLFVVGEILVLQDGSPALIANQDETYNMQEWLSSMKKQLQHPFDISDLVENPINLVSEWMVGYWDDVGNECESASDATLYDKLKATLLQSDSRQGILAIYRNLGRAYIDCATRPNSGDTYAFRHSQFDTPTAAICVDEVRRRIAAYVHPA